LCYNIAVNRLKTKTKANLGRFKVLFLIVAIFSLLLFNFGRSKADDSVDCSQLIGDDKDKCEILEKKAKAYQDLIDIKNKQQHTLKDQMALIDVEQTRNKTQLQQTQAQADQLNQQIGDLQQEINHKEDLVKYQQLILTGLIQSYYEDYQEGVLKIVLINKDFSEILNKADYVEQSSSRVSEVLHSIQQAKTDLQSEYDDIQKKKQESEQLKKDLQSKSYNLQATEIQKQTLLSQTQGEEQKYQQLLVRVEQQKLELFNFSSAGNLADVDASVSSFPKPTDHLASTSWYFSQKDPQWGSKKIGNSSSTIEDYGCALTSVSMVFKYYGASINPGAMAKQKIYYYDLIKWPGSWSSPSIKLSSSISHGNINLKTVDSEISQGHAVIVYIRKTNGRGGHYVVIHNKDDKDYIVHDPYFGPNLYLGTSRALVGKLGADSGTKVDQMIIYK
jgi:peptidoglycan hydrolase CwlO-like protein